MIDSNETLSELTKSVNKEINNQATVEVDDDSVLLFYDYNPSTRTMTPDMKVYQTVKDILAKHMGTPTFNLPKEGKDISVHYIEFIQTDENDFKWEQNTLKWGNDTFTEIEGETGYY